MGQVVWRFEDRCCPVCGRAASEASALGQRGGAAHRAGLGVATGVVRCRSCCAVFQRPTAIPDANPYDAYAPEHYFEAHVGDAKLLAGRQLARTAARFTGGPGRMLEIGCGRGELLRGARQEGWRVAGVEMTKSFADLAATNGIDVELAPADAAASLERAWDAIVLAAVLEHVYDPLLLLRRVWRGLRPGGVVFIDVPNECSLFTRIGNAYARLRGGDWAVNLSPTFPPFHVVGFCPRSLRRILAEAQLDPIVLQLHPWLSCATRREGGCRDRLEGLGMRMTLHVGSWVGMGAGITCWARRGLG